MDELPRRILCDDGNCIGVINERGVCNVCGKALRESQERSEQGRREKERWTEGTMTDHIKQILSELKAKYPITDTWSGEKGEFKVSGIDDTFYIDFLECNHFILHNNYSWHEHFIDQSGDLYGLDGPYSLEEFLDGLFTGTIQIMVKHRGNTPVAQQVGVLRDGKMEHHHRTIAFWPLPRFWRKKCYKKLEYELANSQKMK